MYLFSSPTKSRNNYSASLLLQKETTLNWKELFHQIIIKVKRNYKAREETNGRNERKWKKKQPVIANEYDWLTYIIALAWALDILCFQS